MSNECMISVFRKKFTDPNEMKKLTIILLLLLNIFTGCSPLKKIPDKEVQKIAGFNGATKFNESYRLLRNDERSQQKKPLKMPGNLW